MMIITTMLVLKGTFWEKKKVSLIADCRIEWRGKAGSMDTAQLV